MQEIKTREKLVQSHWDYTSHAKFYEYRPNYAPATIDMLLKTAKDLYKQTDTGGGGNTPLKVADIGAGTGNLSIMLLERGCEVVAVEPNDAMREIGIERTKQQAIKWIRAGGLDTGLSSHSFDWVTFGSSFNVLDRDEALKETHRLLKQGGLFSCMWNHRNLHDPIQEMAEEVILRIVPEYTRGVRREEQRSKIEEHRDLFENIIYTEEDFVFHQTLENYILAWKSVKNPYWDLQTKEGNEIFEKIVYSMRHSLPSQFGILYTTRTWSARAR